MKSPRALLAMVLIMQIATPGLLVGQEPKQEQKIVKEVEFCGPKKAKHRVVKHKERYLPDPPPDKSLIFFYWAGSRFRSWAGVRTKLARDGEYVAVLQKNTYAVIEAEPGLQKLCSSGAGKRTTLDSLLYLTTEPGKSYFLKSSPGGDLFGDNKPILRQVDEDEGLKAIKKCKYVTFEEKD